MNSQRYATMPIPHPTMPWRPGTSQKVSAPGRRSIFPVTDTTARSSTPRPEALRAATGRAESSRGNTHHANTPPSTFTTTIFRTPVGHRRLSGQCRRIFGAGRTPFTSPSASTRTTFPSSWSRHGVAPARRSRSCCPCSATSRTETNRCWAQRGPTPVSCPTIHGKRRTSTSSRPGCAACMTVTPTVAAYVTPRGYGRSSTCGRSTTCRFSTSARVHPISSMLICISSTGSRKRVSSTTSSPTLSCITKVYRGSGTTEWCRRQATTSTGPKQCSMLPKAMPTVVVDSSTCPVTECTGSLRSIQRQEPVWKSDAAGRGNVPGTRPRVNLCSAAPGNRAACGDSGAALHSGCSGSAPSPKAAVSDGHTTGSQRASIPRRPSSSRESARTSRSAPSRVWSTAGGRPDSRFAR